MIEKSIDYNKLSYYQQRFNQLAEQKLPYSLGSRVATIAAEIKRHSTIYQDQVQKMYKEMGTEELDPKSKQMMTKIPDEKIPQFNEELAELNKTRLTLYYDPLKSEDLAVLSAREEKDPALALEFKFYELFNDFTEVSASAVTAKEKGSDPVTPTPGGRSKA